MKPSEKLKTELAALEAWMSTTAYAKWITAREVEAEHFLQTAAISATSWDEVVSCRAQRQNTLEMKNTFEELRDSLKTALADALDSEQ
jgi:hypothetical protein